MTRGPFGDEPPASYRVPCKLNNKHLLRRVQKQSTIARHNTNVCLPKARATNKHNRQTAANITYTQAHRVSNYINTKKVMFHQKSDRTTQRPVGKTRVVIFRS